MKLADKADQIKTLLRDIIRNSRSVVLAEVKDYDFTIPQIQTMHELANHPNITLTELSERLGLAKSTVCGIIERLEAQQAVQKVRDDQDRRMTRLSLAPKILMLRENTHVVQKNFLAGVLEQLSDQEIDEIIRALEKLNRATQVYL